MSVHKHAYMYFPLALNLLACNEQLDIIPFQSILLEEEAKLHFEFITGKENTE